MKITSKHLYFALLSQCLIFILGILYCIINNGYFSHKPYTGEADDLIGYVARSMKSTDFLFKMTIFSWLGLVCCYFINRAYRFVSIKALLLVFLIILSLNFFMKFNLTLILTGIIDIRFESNHTVISVGFMGILLSMVIWIINVLRKKQKQDDKLITGTPHSNEN